MQTKCALSTQTHMKTTADDMEHAFRKVCEIFSIAKFKISTKRVQSKSNRAYTYFGARYSGARSDLPRHLFFSRWSRRRNILENTRARVTKTQTFFRLRCIALIFCQSLETKCNVTVKFALNFFLTLVHVTYGILVSYQSIIAVCSTIVSRGDYYLWCDRWLTSHGPHKSTNRPSLHEVSKRGCPKHS